MSIAGIGPAGTRPSAGVGTQASFDPLLASDRPALNWHQSTRVLLASDLLLPPGIGRSAGIGPSAGIRIMHACLLASDLPAGIRPLLAGIGPCLLASDPSQLHCWHWACAQLASVHMPKDRKCLIDSDVEHEILAMEELELLRRADAAQA